MYAPLVMAAAVYHTETTSSVFVGLCGFQVSLPRGVEERHGSAGLAGGDGCSGTSVTEISN